MSLIWTFCILAREFPQNLLRKYIFMTKKSIFEARITLYLDKLNNDLSDFNHALFCAFLKLFLRKYFGSIPANCRSNGGHIQYMSRGFTGVSTKRVSQTYSQLFARIDGLCVLVNKQVNKSMSFFLTNVGLL